MGRPELGEAGAQHFFRARLADAAGDCDDARLSREPVTRCATQRFEPVESIRNAIKRAVAWQPLISVGDESRCSAGVEGRRDELVPIALIFERDEKIAC